MVQFCAAKKKFKLLFTFLIVKVQRINALQMLSEIYIVVLGELSLIPQPVAV